MTDISMELEARIKRNKRELNLSLVDNPEYKDLVTEFFKGPLEVCNKEKKSLQDLKNLETFWNLGDITPDIFKQIVRI